MCLSEVILHKTVKSEIFLKIKSHFYASSTAEYIKTTFKITQCYNC